MWPRICIYPMCLCTHWIVYQNREYKTHGTLLFFHLGHKPARSDDKWQRKRISFKTWQKTFPWEEASHLKKQNKNPNNNDNNNCGSFGAIMIYSVINHCINKNKHISTCWHYGDKLISLISIWSHCCSICRQNELKGRHSAHVKYQLNGVQT